MLDDLLIQMGADPLMEGSAPETLRRVVSEVEKLRLNVGLLEADPCRLKDWKSLPPTTLTADAEGRVVFTLPDDFLMLLSMRLEGWERPVREVLSPTNWLYRLQSARWTGLRGTPQRPLAFFTADDEGRPALELFSVSPGSSVELVEFKYHPMVEIT